MSRQIKNTNVVQTPPILIDPRLWAPEDVIDIGTGTKEGDGSNSVVPEEEMTVPPAGTPAGGDSTQNGGTTSSSNSPDTINPPTNFNIVSQDLHTAQDGHTVVDVTVEWDDVSGASDYDVRVTKVQSYVG